MLNFPEFLPSSATFLKPNGQLMSIHAFVQKDGNSKQFRLLFVRLDVREAKSELCGVKLPFLPWTHVPNVFRKMEERAPPNLQPLTSCIRHQCLRKYLSNFHCGIS